jgi:putative membrane protein
VVVLMWSVAVLAGVVHVLIFCMESLWWTSAPVRARFRQTPEQADATRLFAFNQGFYNLFLAVGALAGFALSQLGFPRAGVALAGWNCLCMLGAAIVLLASARKMWRGALIQGAMPLLFLAISIIWWTSPPSGP